MAINCNFAQTAIHHFCVKIHDKTKQNSLWFNDSYCTIQTHFNETPNLTIASKKFPTITRNFSNRWHPSETKRLYLSTFSISEWNTLAPEEKTNHTLCDCQICQTKYQHLSIPCSNFIASSAGKLYINTI